MTNEIYTEDKMNQKPVYPTKTTPSYADWKLFEMGKALEEKVDESSGGGYTAGSGIAISDEKVISNTAQPDVTKAYVDNVDVSLQQQIDAIVASSDVRDIVGTYAQLQAYDTTTLGDNDIIKVLVDSTHNDATGYYRWVITEGTGAWTYIGSEGPYYTKAQVDTELLDKMEKDFSNADVGQATAGQVLQVNASANGVEFADIVAGEGYKHVVTTSPSPQFTIQGYRSSSYQISNLNTDYDYIIMIRVIGSALYVPSDTTSNSNFITFGVQNITSANESSAHIAYSIYRRPKVGATNRIDLIGCSPGTANGYNNPTIKAIPGISGKGGKVLKVNTSGIAIMWDNETTELPSTTGNAGKVLAVNSGATGVEWVTPSGGSGKTAVTAITDLSVGDIFIGSITWSGSNYGISGYVSELTSTTITIRGAIISGTASFSDSYDFNITAITSISGYKI